MGVAWNQRLHPGATATIWDMVCTSANRALHGAGLGSRKVSTYKNADTPKWIRVEEGVRVVRVFLQGSADTLCATEPTRLLDLVDECAERPALVVACRSARCGICQLRCLRGEDFLRPAEAAERQTLFELGAERGLRLGCQLVVEGDREGEVELALVDAAARTS